MGAVTYSKLKSGEWGVRIVGEAPAAGAAVTVTKRSGETKAETIARVLWSGEGVHLCEIAPSAPRATSNGAPHTRRGSTVCSCGARKPARYETCWDCKSAMDEDMGYYR